MATTEPTDGFLLDVNVLVALALPQHVHHERAHAWFADLGEWATTPITEAAFVRLTTNRAVVGATVRVAQAIEVLRRLHELPTHRFLPDDASFVDARVSLDRLTSSRDVTDLHLVNLAARHGLGLATLDRGIPSLLAEADRHHVIVIP